MGDRLQGVVRRLQAEFGIIKPARVNAHGRTRFKTQNVQAQFFAQVFGKAVRRHIVVAAAAEHVGADVNGSRQKSARGQHDGFGVIKSIAQGYHAADASVRGGDFNGFILHDFQVGL